MYGFVSIYYDRTTSSLLVRGYYQTKAGFGKGLPQLESATWDNLKNVVLQTIQYSLKAYQTEDMQPDIDVFKSSRYKSWNKLFLHNDSINIEYDTSKNIYHIYLPEKNMKYKGYSNMVDGYEVYVSPEEFDVQFDGIIHNFFEHAKTLW